MAIWCKDKPWLKIYEEAGFPHTLEYPKIPLYELVDRAVREYPDSPSMVYLGKEYTYKELGTFIDKLATALAELGVKKGDVIGVHLVNTPQFVIGSYGGLKAGATVTLFSPLLSLEDLCDQLKRSGTKVIITEDVNLNKLKKIKDSTKLEHIIITNLNDYSALAPSSIPEVSGAIQFKTLLDKTEPDLPKLKINPKEDVAALFFTGGTTGVPKAPMLTHHNLTTNILQLFTPTAGGIMDPNRGDFSVMGSLPLFHIMGFSCAMNLALNWAAALLLVPDPRNVEMIYNMIKEYRPLWTPGVPTQFMKLVEAKGLDLTEMQGTIPFSGSAALPPEVSKKYEKRADILLSEGYGLSETSPATHANYIAILKGVGADFGLPVKLGSIGIPIPDTEVEIINPETEEPVPAGKNGELILKGPQVMKGYWPNTGEGLRDGWLYTGDIARMDEDGYFYIVDRTKDMINVSGLKVYGRVVDDVLFEHPAVLEAAAIGIPDPGRPGSERVKAFIMLRERYTPSKKLEEDIIRHCRDRLPPYAVPRSIEFRDELPLTVTEKIFKRKLREEEIAKMKKEGVL